MNHLLEQVFELLVSILTKDCLKATVLLNLFTKETSLEDPRAAT